MLLNMLIDTGHKAGEGGFAAKCCAPVIFTLGGMKRVLLHLTLVVTAALLSACNQGCENEIASQLVSPSGKLQAIVFHRNCGATVGFNTQVSVISASSSFPNEAGNVLIVDGRVQPEIQWSSEGQLFIAGTKGAKVFKQERSIVGLEVEYK